LRHIGKLLVLIGISITVHASQFITVDQLQHFLSSRRTTKQSDDSIAERLSSVDLSEQLTSQMQARIIAESNLRPKTIEQLQLLAASSIFKAPPIAEIPNIPAPDIETQNNLIHSAREYVKGTLSSLPDFMATRETTSFNDEPQPMKAKGPIPLHYAARIHTQMAYRNNREIDDTAIEGSAQARRLTAIAGLTTWGEFGPILIIILSDISEGSFTWARWQTSDAGNLVAVFDYTVPASASHYRIDFCCYQQSLDHPALLRFEKNPAYRGELYLDPMSGAIDRMTLEAELSDIYPITSAGIAVQYWPDPRFPHRTEYDFRIQEGAERCRGASTPRRR
jgi:hypothetical protein